MPHVRRGAGRGTPGAGRYRRVHRGNSNSGAAPRHRSQRRADHGGDGGSHRHGRRCAPHDRFPRRHRGHPYPGGPRRERGALRPRHEVLGQCPLGLGSLVQRPVPVTGLEGPTRLWRPRTRELLRHFRDAPPRGGSRRDPGGRPGLDRGAHGNVAATVPFASQGRWMALDPSPGRPGGRRRRHGPPAARHSHRPDGSDGVRGQAEGERGALPLPHREPPGGFRDARRGRPIHLRQRQSLPDDRAPGGRDDR
jgi:hypothetical protein